MLSAINITQRYGKRVLFEKINLTLDGGKRYGLIGANGAGKSTFLKILAQQIEPTSGEIQVKPNLKVGVLGQNQFAFEQYTLIQTVMMGNKRFFDAYEEKQKLYIEGDFDSEEVKSYLCHHL